MLEACQVVGESGLLGRQAKKILKIVSFRSLENYRLSWFELALKETRKVL